jgi:UDPglucose--hexose-1-phosphate uridylyltransferase
VELRKDPITRSWVITGDDFSPGAAPQDSCIHCADSTWPSQVVSTVHSPDGGGWASRAVVHPAPIYRVEGEPARRGDGLYDRMQTIGAHEVLVENPGHDRHLWVASDAEIGRFLMLAGGRILDLKRDQRFKYVTIFKNHGPVAGQEFEHPTSQLTATTFVPRRVLYELRAGRDYFAAKERCVFCDILTQEQQQAVRVVEVRGDFIATCPYAPRVPYETWILPLVHESSFGRGLLTREHSMLELGALLRRTLQRIRTVTEDFHLVLHTTPNTQHKSSGPDYWKTLDEDYHWHIEILPIVGKKSQSYTFKETYFTPLTSETAARRLREVSSLS